MPWQEWCPVEVFCLPPTLWQQCVVKDLMSLVFTLGLVSLKLSFYCRFSVASDGRNAIRRPWSSQYGADRCHGNTGTQHEPPGGRRLYSMFSACWTGMTYSFISLLIRLFLQTSWSSCSPWIQSKKRSLPLAARLYSAGVSILEDSCRLNPLAAGLNLSPGLKTDASSKEIEEAMKRVREAQSLISAAIEPGSEFSPPLSPRCFSRLSRFYHQA